MKEWTILHNPQCSKSREALRLLQEAGIEPEVIEYLRHPLKEESLLALMGKLLDSPDRLVRGQAHITDSKAIAKQLAQNPELMERPIVIRGEKALIARPPERWKELNS